MRVLVTPSGIDFESESVIGIERSEWNPGSEGMDRYPYRPDFRFGIPV
jgi:hypothetical protein